MSRPKRAGGSPRRPDRSGAGGRSPAERTGGAGRAGRGGGGDRPGRGGRAPGRPSPAARRSRSDRGLGGDQVEGRQAVRELLLAGRRKVQEVLVAADQDDAEVLRDIVELGSQLGVSVREVSRRTIESEARTESHQGVVAFARPLEETPLDDLVTGARDGRTGRPVAPFLLALDGVTDPGNLGALLRSAECAGVTGVVLPRHRAVHVTPTVTKAAAGAVEYLPMTLVGGLPAAISELQAKGVWVVGFDAEGDTSLFDITVADEPVCLVMGAEGAGLSRLVRERCDAVASIPMRGNLASLNVSAAGALACYEITRRRNEHP